MGKHFPIQMQAWVFITKVPVAASSYIGIKD
jgi:hypothetical protein